MVVTGCQQECEMPGYMEPTDRKQRVCFLNVINSRTTAHGVMQSHSECVFHLQSNLLGNTLLDTLRDMLP